jgi:trimethylamine--corrinoid protein Co-methyltransferase
VHDAGSWLDHGSLASPAFMVLVNEILYMVNQYMGGVPVNDETLALDMIDRIGPGGHYLYEDHTLNNFKNVRYSDLFDRTIYQVWEEQVALNFDERLRRQTEKLMDHQPAPLPADVLKEMERMARHWQ